MGGPAGMKILLVVVGGLLSLACKATDPNASEYGPAQGNSTLSFSGTVSDRQITPDGFPTTKNTSVIGQVGYGYFVTDKHEIGARLAVDIFDSNVAGADRDLLELSLLYNYNFSKTPRTWWYVGADAGIVHVDDEGAGSSDDFIYGVHVGMRQWISPTTAIVVEPFYQNATFETAAGDADEDRFGVLFGFEVTL